MGLGQSARTSDGDAESKAYSTGGLAFETCLGGGEPGGSSNGEEGGRLHDVLVWCWVCVDWIILRNWCSVQVSCSWSSNRRES